MVVVTEHKALGLILGATREENKEELTWEPQGSWQKPWPHRHCEEYKQSSKVYVWEGLYKEAAYSYGKLRLGFR